MILKPTSKWSLQWPRLRVSEVSQIQTNLKVTLGTLGLLNILPEINCNDFNLVNMAASDLIAKVLIENREDVTASIWPRLILLKSERGDFVQPTCRWYKSIFQHFQVILKIDIEMKKNWPNYTFST